MEDRLDSYLISPTVDPSTVLNRAFRSGKLGGGKAASSFTAPGTPMIGKRRILRSACVGAGRDDELSVGTSTRAHEHGVGYILVE